VGRVGARVDRVGRRGRFVDFANHERWQKMSEQLTLSTRTANQAEMSVIMAAMSAVIESGKAVNRAIAAATIARGLDFVRNWSSVERVAETQNRLNSIVRGITNNSLVVRVAPNDGGRVTLMFSPEQKINKSRVFPLWPLLGGLLSLLVWLGKHFKTNPKPKK
jgi:hypothetical protein